MEMDAPDEQARNDAQHTNALKRECYNPNYGRIEAAGGAESGPIISTASHTSKDERANDVQLDSERPDTAGTTQSTGLGEAERVLIQKCAPTGTTKKQRKGEPHRAVEEGKLLSRSNIIFEIVQPPFVYAKPHRRQSRVSSARGPLSLPDRSRSGNVVSKSRDQDSSHHLKGNTTTSQDRPPMTLEESDHHNDSSQREHERTESRRPGVDASLPSKEYQDHDGQLPGAHNHRTIEPIDETAPLIIADNEDSPQTGAEGRLPAAIEHQKASTFQQDDVDDTEMNASNHASPQGEYRSPTLSVHPPTSVEQEIPIQQHSTAAGKQTMNCSSHPNRNVSLEQADTDSLASDRTNQSHAIRPPSHESDSCQNKEPEVLHRVSNRSGKVKVSKRKLKTTAPTFACTSNRTVVTDVESSDINDCAQMLLYRVQQSREESDARFAAMNEEYRTRLETAISVNEDLERQFLNACREKDRLSKANEAQESKVASYQNILLKLQMFVAGVGNDFDTLKREANLNRRQYEDLVAENEEAKLERQSLLQQLQICIEQNARLKSDAIQVSRESQSVLQQSVQQCKHLGEELSEKTWLLSKERDRYARLEELAGAPSSLQQTIAETLQVNHNSLLDKLYEVQLALENYHRSITVPEMLEKIHAAILALNDQAASGTNDVLSLRIVLEELEQKLSDEFKQISPRQNEALLSDAEERINETLTELKSTLVQNSAVSEQATVNRATITALQEQVLQADARISDAQKTNEKLTLDNSALQSRLMELQNQPSPPDTVRAQLDELQSELDKTGQVLKSTRAELSQKISEVHSTSATNATLQKQLQLLQARLDDVQSNTADFDREKERIGKQAQDQLEQSRADMNAHVEQFETELKARTENEIKRLTSEKAKVESQMRLLAEELSRCKASINESQKQSSQSVSDEEVHKLRDLSKTQKQDITKLQKSISILQASLRSNSSLQERYDTIAKELEGEKHKTCAMSEEKNVLAKQVEDLQRIADEVSATHIQENSELEVRLTETKAVVEDLEMKVSQANEAAERATAGLEHYKNSSRSAIDETRGKAERQVKALQESLSEVQAELEARRNDEERFRTEVEQSWQAEQQGFEDRAAELRQRAVDAESKHDEALQSNERLREELQEALGEQRDPSLKPTAQADRGAEAADQRSQMQRSAALVLGESISDVQTLPTHGGQSKARGPVVEETPADQSSFTSVSTKLAARSESLGHFSDNDEMLSVAGFASQSQSQTIPETQAQDGLLSFAAFNETLPPSSQSARSKDESLTTPVPFVPNSQDGRGSNGFDVQKQPTSGEEMEQGFRWSQAGTDNRTFRKTFPRPNSASKLVRRDTNDSGRSSRRSNSQDNATSQGAQAEAVAATSVGSLRRLQSAASNSSSPGFVDPNAGRIVSKYDAPKKTGPKRDVSTTRVNSSVDPRLIARNPSRVPKRKAEEDLQQTYEQQLKRGPEMNSVRAQADATPLPLRARTQRSSNNPPAFLRKRAGAASSQNSGFSHRQLRVQSLAGSNSQPNKRTRKTSKRNEYETRFSQELSQR